MTGVKTLLCFKSKEEHVRLIEALQVRHFDTEMIKDAATLQSILMGHDGGQIAVILLEQYFLDEIQTCYPGLLGAENNLWVLVEQAYNEQSAMRSFIYDTFNDRSSACIDHFLNRLQKDISVRIKLLKLQMESAALYDIGKDLSAEKDVNKLLDKIIEVCMALTSSDAGTIFLIVDEKSGSWSKYKDMRSKNKLLKFAVAKNKSMDLKLEAVTSPISHDGIFGCTVISGKPIRIEDAYQIPEDEEYRFNPSFDRMTGYKTKSILSVPMKDHEDYVLGVIQLINKTESEGIIPYSYKDERLIYSLAGQAAVVLENNLLVKEMENLLEQYRMTIKDEIIKRKNADVEINKLLSAIEHSPNAVTITDATGNIEYVNAKYTELTGFAAKEVIGKDAGILKTDIHTPDVYRKIWDTIMKGLEWHGEVQNRRKNCESYWESVSISSIRDELSNIKYFTIIEEDITEKKRMEKEIIEKNLELQEAIAELKETQAHLIQQEKMIGIGHLAAGVAHEINNPLGFIMCNCDSLKKYSGKLKHIIEAYQLLRKDIPELGPSEIQKRFHEIGETEKEMQIQYLLGDLNDLFEETESGLKTVTAIVKALRAFSGIDQIGEVGAYDAVKGIQATLAVAANELRDISDMKIELQPVPYITVDGGEMNQVILALLLNSVYAVKLIEDKPCFINIRTYTENDWICIEIEDNGIGIEAENMQKIFNYFYTTKPVGKGAGLGLAMAYDIIVKKYKGRIEVESEPMQGAKFILKLPIDTK